MGLIVFLCLFLALKQKEEKNVRRDAQVVIENRENMASMRVSLLIVWK